MATNDSIDTGVNSTPSNKHPQKREDSKKVTTLLFEIAQLAHAIQTQAAVAIETTAGREQNLLLGIQALARQAGLFADMCQEEVDNSLIQLDPMEWLCPETVSWPSLSSATTTPLTV